MVKNLIFTGLALVFFASCADNSIKINKAELSGSSAGKKALPASNLNCENPKLYRAELPCADCWVLHSNLKICGDRFELVEYYDGAKASAKKDFVTLGKVARKPDIWTLRADSNLKTNSNLKAKGEEIVLLKNLGGGSLIRLAPDGTEPSGVLREYYIYRAR